MRTSSVFKSRWMALIWAAGIVWFAVDFAQSKTPAANDTSAQASADADGTTANSDDVNTAASALGL
jgi:hypothetical protein